MSKRHTRHPHITPMKRRGATFWKISFCLEGTQFRRRGFATYEIAEQVYNETRAAIRNGSYFKGSSALKPSATMNEVYEYYRTHKGAKRSSLTIDNGLGNWNNHIGPFMGHLRPSRVTRRVLSAFVDKMRSKGITDNSIGSLKAETNNVLKMARDYELVEYLPTWPKLSPRPKKKSIFTPDEVSLIAKKMPTEQLKLMTVVQFQLALRVNELMALRPEAIDVENLTVLIDRQVGRAKRHIPWKDRFVPTKNRIKRHLPISSELAELLRPLLLCRQDEQGPLWISSRGTGMCESTYQVALKKAAIAAGMTKPISSHSLRTSCLSFLTNNSGMSIIQTAWFGRHDAETLLKHYAQPDVTQVFDFFGRKSALTDSVNCNLPAIEAFDDA